MITTLLFFITALLYASVGFGGGSTYNALLVIGGIDYTILPIIALSCNIIVVTGGVIRFHRAGHMAYQKALPWFLFSIPAAWVGGQMAVSEQIFVSLLGIGLLLSGLYMLIENKITDIGVKSPIKDHIPLIVSAFFGSGLGLLAGITGIGGGIFLAPILHVLRYETPKKIAAICSLFILVNSMAGLGGQLTKSGDINSLTIAVLAYWPLLLAVFIGGQIGSYLGAVKLKATIIKKMTAVLILYVALRLLWRAFIT